MNPRGGAALYTPEILALAVTLADYPLTAALRLRGEAQSRVCGSWVAMGLEVDAAGRIAAAGAMVTACAIGQSAAALFLASAQGKGRAAIAASRDAVAAWLAGEGAMPAWPGMAALAAARAYPARHAAILLPWRAALEALSNPAAAD